MGTASVLEHNLTSGGWEPAPGAPLVAEPSAHTIVEGQERTILLRAAAIGTGLDRACVAVAIRDPSGAGAIFTVRVTPGHDWHEEIDDLAGPIVRAGAGGVSALLDRPELKVLADGPEAAARVREALGAIPSRFAPVASEIPARVHWLRAEDYDAYLDEPDDDGEPEVIAEVIIGGAANAAVVEAAGRARFEEADVRAVEAALGLLKGRAAEEGLDAHRERVAALAERGALSPVETECLRLALGVDDGRPRSLREIAGRLGITRERIPQALRRLLERMRRSLRPREGP